MEAVLFGWPALSIVVGVWAHTRGRFGMGWGIISLMLSPLVGGVIVAALPKAGKAAYAKDELGNTISHDTHVQCPDCRELVRKDARKCKHCQSALVPQL